MTEQTVENTPKPTKKHIAYAALVEQGMSKSEACRMLGIARNTGYEAERRLNIYEQQRDSLLRSSVKAVQKLVKGEPFGTIDKVKDSTALAAAGMILDREVPKINVTQSLNLNVNIDPIDLKEFRRAVDNSVDSPPAQTVDNSNVVITAGCEEVRST